MDNQQQYPAPPLPANAHGLCALIAAAMSRGIGLGHELQPEIEEVLRTCGFAAQPDDWAACDSRVRRALDELTRAAAARLPAYCSEDAPARRWVRMALHEGLVAGMEVYRDAMREQARRVPISDRQHAIMPADPAWVHERASDVLHRLLQILRGLRITVPRADDELERVQ